MDLTQALATQDGLYYVGHAVKDLTYVMWLIAFLLAAICARMK